MSEFTPSQSDIRILVWMIEKYPDGITPVELDLEVSKLYLSTAWLYNVLWMCVELNIIKALTTYPFPGVSRRLYKLTNRGSTHSVVDE